MMKNLSVAGASALILLLVSCTTVHYDYVPSDVKDNSPEATFYNVVRALRTGDTQTAKSWTLYGEYVDWDQVMREVHGTPKKYRINKVLYKDATPQMFNSSMIYYLAADGNNYVVEFTRIGDRWYWGSRVNKNMARLIQIRSQRIQVTPE